MHNKVVVGRAGRVVEPQADAPRPPGAMVQKENKHRVSGLPYFALAYVLTYVPLWFIVPRLYAILGASVFGFLAWVVSKIEVSE